MRIDQDQRWLEQPDRHLITLHDEQYPALLRIIPDPPPLLFVYGNPVHLQRHQIAIIGSRNPSSIGVTNAHQFAEALARAGLAITSGLALGIDAAGHRGALTSDGITIAVAGTGLDRIYPARHKDLAHKIVQQGALVSEFPPGTAAHAHHFPRRNRIISGLAVGVLVVEAAIRSGSLITARLALEQGRELFAIPGSIHNPLTKGCNALIRQGAKLVETTNDILEELGPLIALTALAESDQAALSDQATEHALSDEYQTVLNAIAYEPTAIDTVVEQSGFRPEIVASMLLVLELQGYVSPCDGGGFQRTPKS